MELMARRMLNPRLRRLTIGCGLQGEDCLAMAVKGRPAAWRIEWGLAGKRHDPAFWRELRKKVWRRPLWAPPWESGVEQDMVVCGVDVHFETGTRRGRVPASEQRAALRTQVMSRYAHVADPACLCGLELRGPDGEYHLVGAAARREAIRMNYREWRHGAGIIHPHIGATAAALANVYLALYPEEERRRQPWRMLVLEGRETTHAVLMQDWRLLDSIQYQMMPGQRLEPVLMEQWIQYSRERNRIAEPLVPLVVASYDDSVNVPENMFWFPFKGLAPTMCGQGVEDLIASHPDLAPLAFGMALQGK
jgi:hypothetical protein